MGPCRQGGRAWRPSKLCEGGEKEKLDEDKEDDNEEKEEDEEEKMKFLRRRWRGREGLRRTCRTPGGGGE